MSFMKARKRILLWTGLLLLLGGTGYLVLPEPHSTPDGKPGYNTSHRKLAGLLKKAGLQPVESTAQIPDFALSNLQGSLLRLSDQRGKILLLHFWATWCPECRKEIPSIEKIHRSFQDRDFMVLAVNIKESAENVRRYMDAHSLTFTSVLDTRGQVSRDSAIRFIPTTFIIGKDGAVMAKAVGPQNWAGDDIFKLVAYLVDGDQPPNPAP